MKGQVMMGRNEICVPDSALRQAGEDGGDIAPEVGDEVEVTVRGPVTRREGGNTYFTPATANGEPIQPGPDSDGDETDLDRRGAALDREMAGYADAGSEAAL